MGPIVIGNPDVAEPADISWQSVVPPTLSSQQKTHFGSQFCRLKKELLHAAFAVWQTMPNKKQVAGKGRVPGYRMVSFRIKGVINRTAVPCAQTKVMLNDGRPSTVSKDMIIVGNLGSQGIIAVR